MRKFATIIVLPLLFFACNAKKDLSRDEALSLIKTSGEYPKAIEYEVYCSDPVYAKKLLDAGLEQLGFVTIKRSQKLADVGKPLIEFTSKAQTYLLPVTDADKGSGIQKVKIADEELTGITGITILEDGNRAVADYTTTYKNVSPFAKLAHQTALESGSHKAYFALYDDGWRLENKSAK